MELPPGMSETDLIGIPTRHREDAVQEAWLAHLQGQDPVKAARNYKDRETFHERREPSFSSLGMKP